MGYTSIEYRYEAFTLDWCRTGIHSKIWLSGYVIYIIMQKQLTFPKWSIFNTKYRCTDITKHPAFACNNCDFLKCLTDAYGFHILNCPISLRLITVHMYVTAIIENIGSSYDSQSGFRSYIFCSHCWRDTNCACRGNHLAGDLTEIDNGCFFLVCVLYMEDYADAPYVTCVLGN